MGPGPLGLCPMGPGPFGKGPTGQGPKGRAQWARDQWAGAQWAGDQWCHFKDYCLIKNIQQMDSQAGRHARCICYIRPVSQYIS